MWSLRPTSDSSFPVQMRQVLLCIWMKMSFLWEQARMGWDDEQGRKDPEGGVITGVMIRIGQRVWLAQRASLQMWLWNRPYVALLWQAGQCLEQSPLSGTLRVERRHCGSLCGSLDMSLWVCSGCCMLHPIIVLCLFCFVLAMQALPARTAQQDLLPESLCKDFWKTRGAKWIEAWSICSQSKGRYQFIWTGIASSLAIPPSHIWDHLWLVIRLMKEWMQRRGLKAAWKSLAGVMAYKSLGK